MNAVYDNYPPCPCLFCIACTRDIY